MEVTTTELFNVLIIEDSFLIDCPNLQKINLNFPDVIFIKGNFVTYFYEYEAQCEWDKWAKANSFSPLPGIKLKKRLVKPDPCVHLTVELNCPNLLDIWTQNDANPYKSFLRRFNSSDHLEPIVEKITKESEERFAFLQKNDPFAFDYYRSCHFKYRARLPYEK